MNLLKDIYYQKEYISLYLKQDEEIFEFNFSEEDYLFTNLAIKRPINKIGNLELDEIYYDIETVYGYGGIYSNTDNQDFLNRAFIAYQKHCHENKVIADFSRIHPFNKTHLNLKEKFDLHILDRKTVVVDTNLDQAKRWEEYPTKVRNILRRCNKELSLKKSDNLSNFIALYNETMLKNNADDFYFFDKKYFEELISLKNVELYEVLYNNIVISASFVMFGDKIAHYHLSANNYEYRKQNANYFILDSLFGIAHQKGIHYFYLGGGRTNLEDDNLFRFKKKFSPLQKDFYIGGIIHNKMLYNKYNEIWKKQNDREVKYFLKYRLNN